MLPSVIVEAVTRLRAARLAAEAEAEVKPKAKQKAAPASKAKR
jgi:hypothetical protein